MTLTEEQFAELREQFPTARCDRIGDGSHIVTVPNVELPDGWNAKETTVRFVAPVGFPVSRPDCFWSDEKLKLAGGGNPQNTGVTQLPDGSGPHLWFSWHVDRWSPNSDTLLTYLRVIEARFRHPK